jgi:hypothetical protein
LEGWQALPTSLRAQYAARAVQVNSFAARDSIKTSLAAAQGGSAIPTPQRSDAHGV